MKTLRGMKDKLMELKESKNNTYKRLLLEKCDDDQNEAPPKGYVPIIIGSDAMSERFLVHVKLFKEPQIAQLLDMAENELGHQQQGILRIPCDIEHFRRILDAISKPK